MKNEDSRDHPEPRAGSKSSTRINPAMTNNSDGNNSNNNNSHLTTITTSGGMTGGDTSFLNTPSKLRSIPNMRHTDEQQLLHYPSKQLLNLANHTSLRSPRLNNPLSPSSDYFPSNLGTPMDEQASLLGITTTARPGLIRQHSMLHHQQQPPPPLQPVPTIQYGAINDNKVSVSSIQEETDPVVQKTYYYDDFTTIDWLDNSTKQSERLSQLTKLSTRSWRGKFLKNFDNAKNWILIVIISFFCACLAYCIDTVENVLIDLKRGYCTTSWFMSESACCSSSSSSSSMMSRNFIKNGNGGEETLCPNFVSWSELLPNEDSFPIEFAIYASLTLLLAYLAAHITLLTKTTNPLLSYSNETDNNDKATRKYNHKVWYTAYGSGVPEVKTILSGFIIRKFLGTWTLICKSSSLVLAIASGMALGKEGPYVHLSACIGNICCRIFSKINRNELEKRQILTAATSAGVALAFGSPLGAVLFSIEEITYYLPINQLFHIFICAMSSTLFLKFLNPYGTGKTVLFEVNYSSDWEPIELIFFIFIGVAGGIFGAMFCLFTQWWSAHFRTIGVIKRNPVLEVSIVAALTALTTFHNKYTKTPTTELLYELASPCTMKNQCPILKHTQVSDAGGVTVIVADRILPELVSLVWAFVIKVALTSTTFGLKLPAGIYVPSMTVGALFGRSFAMFLQFIAIKYPYLLNLASAASAAASGSTPVSPGIPQQPDTGFSNDDNITDIDFGIYAMIGAGAFMAGVTRMNVTLAAILFELTSSYTYVLPISISIAIANWVANMIEPDSLYELLIAKNDFPFLDNRKTPVFLDKTIRAIDLIPTNANSNFILDTTNSVTYPMSVLKAKLELLQQSSLLDGCLSVVKNHGDTVVGLLPAPILELQLDKLENFAQEYGITDEIMVKLGKLDEIEDSDNSDLFSNVSNFLNPEHESVILDLLDQFTDLTKIIDYNPVFLNHDSKLNLVYSVFSKLGNREICILNEDGKFVGTMHKKVFIDYCKRQKIQHIN